MELAEYEVALDPSKTYIPSLVKKLMAFSQENSGRAIPLINEAIEEIMGLRERLEIGYAYNIEGDRVACEAPYDGIYCRDATIKLQDEHLDRYKRLEAILRNESDVTGDSDRLRPNDAMRLLSEWEDGK